MKRQKQISDFPPERPSFVQAKSRSACSVFAALLILRGAKRAKGTDWFRVTYREITAQTDLQRRGTIGKALHILGNAGWIDRKRYFDVEKRKSIMHVSILLRM